MTLLNLLNTYTISKITDSCVSFSAERLRAVQVKQTPL